MAVLDTPVTVLVSLLFAAIAALLAYGAYAFRHAPQPADMRLPGGRQVDMRLEVLWTGCAAVLLLAVFAVVR
jgi:heme/copper-type cytochrome/quinol oxidase subunit 2